jgi:hypothetical protein
MTRSAAVDLEYHLGQKVGWPAGHPVQGNSRIGPEQFSLITRKTAVQKYIGVNIFCQMTILMQKYYIFKILQLYIGFPLLLRAGERQTISRGVANEWDGCVSFADGRRSAAVRP